MHCARILLGAVAMLTVASAVAGQASKRETLQDAWFTGPMLAPPAGTLPEGHLLVEPYLFCVAAAGTRTYGTLTYLLYGLTNRLTVGVIPTADYETAPHGANSTRLEPGNLSLAAQIGLRRYHEGSWGPAMAFNLQETPPTGKYDNLGSHPTDGFGAGTYTTSAALYTQTYFWLPNGRILRVRFNLSQAWSKTAPVTGTSVYGTSSGISGTVRPRRVTFADLAGEYSVSRRWAVALDIAGRHRGRDWIQPRGAAGKASVQPILAPAVEYNLNARLGVLADVRLIEAGQNFMRSLTPAVAINFLY